MKKYNRPGEDVEIERQLVTETCSVRHRGGAVLESEVRVLVTDKWLVYRQAAIYVGLSVRYLRNLVSAERIPVYGPPRSRRFNVNMLDLWIADRDAAMRKFLAER